MLTYTESSAQAANDNLPLVEVSSGVSNSKDGKGIGDLVDAATILGWVREYLTARKTSPEAGNEVDEVGLAKAFQFGVRAEGRYAGQSFVEAEPQIRSEWSSERNQLPWESVRDCVWAGFDRARDRSL